MPKRLLAAAGCLGVVVIAAVLMLWRSGTAAEGRLTAARAALTHLRSAIAAGDLTVAARRLHEVQVDCASARSRTSGPVWAGASSVPTPAARHERYAEDRGGRGPPGRDTLPGLVAAARMAAGDGLVKAGGGVDVNQLGRIGRCSTRPTPLSAPSTPASDTCLARWSSAGCAGPVTSYASSSVT